MWALENVLFAVIFGASVGTAWYFGHWGLLIVADLLARGVAELEHRIGGVL